MRSQTFRRLGLALPLAALINISSAVIAFAHVKWFCAFNVAGQPRSVENVLCPDFEILVAFSLVLLIFGNLLEETRIGQALLRGLDFVTAPLNNNSDVLIRACCGFFLVALWTLGGIILTPELTTKLPWVPWLQLAMAACLIWRQTLIFTSLGIVFLFALAVKTYGVFHLLDYPVFLGVATYLGLSCFGRNLFGLRPIDVLRGFAAITLMWASIEKWAYPEWSFVLFLTHPELAMGFSQEFFMRAAGAVEFALSFAILLSPLVRRTAALVLLGMFVSAIGPFGKVDAIGHSVIIGVLLAIIADNARGGSLLKLATDSLSQIGQGAMRISVGYAAALATFIALYYGLHSLIFSIPAA